MLFVQAKWKNYNSKKGREWEDMIQAYVMGKEQKTQS